MVHKMRKASSNLIPSANRSSNNPVSSSGNGSAAIALPLASNIGPVCSSMRGARDSLGATHDSGLASTGDLHHDDSSSVGSESLDSGQNSPAIEVGHLFLNCIEASHTAQILVLLQMIIFADASLRFRITQDVKRFDIASRHSTASRPSLTHGDQEFSLPKGVFHL